MMLSQFIPIIDFFFIVFFIKEPSVENEPARKSLGVTQWLRPHQIVTGIYIIKSKCNTRSKFL